MKSIVVVLASSIIATVLAMQGVSAKGRPAAGSFCAYFTGQKIVGINNRFTFSDYRCFPTQAECKSWVYRVQSDWPFEQDVRFCHRGG